MTKNTIFKGDVSNITIKTGDKTDPTLRCIISKKLFPKAVLRNKAKRLCREAWHKSNLSKSQGTQVTINIKQNSAHLKNISLDLYRAKTRWLNIFGAKE